jgi:hypothetical protein
MVVRIEPASIILLTRNLDFGDKRLALLDQLLHWKFALNRFDRISECLVLPHSLISSSRIQPDRLLHPPAKVRPCTMIRLRPARTLSNVIRTKLHPPSMTSAKSSKAWPKTISAFMTLDWSRVAKLAARRRIRRSNGVGRQWRPDNGVYTFGSRARSHDRLLSAWTSLWRASSSPRPPAQPADRCRSTRCEGTGYGTLLSEKIESRMTAAPACRRLCRRPHRDCQPR